MKKTFSILGCGWLGIPLATYFIKNSITVKGSTRSKDKIEKLQDLGILPFVIDIENNIDHPGFFDCDVLLIMITSKNLNAYQKLVETIEKSSVTKVIFISSTSVYPSNNKLNTEEDEVDESVLLSKVEKLFRENNKFSTTIIRFAGLIGGERHPGNWFENREIPQPNGYVNMIYREDCIQIISQLIQKDCFGETFNACVNHHPTREEFYKAARKSLGKPEPTFKDEAKVLFKKVSPLKLINRLNYQFIHDDLLKL